VAQKVSDEKLCAFFMTIRRRLETSVSFRDPAFFREDLLDNATKNLIFA